MWWGSWYNSDWRVGAKPADKTRMGTGRRLPNHLLAYAVTGLLNFGLSLILSTKSEVRKDTCTDSLPANDERRPLVSGNTVDAHESDTKPYEQLSFLKSLLPTLSKESRSLIFKLCLLFAIDSIASGLTVVMGIVNVVKTLSQSLGPVVTGALAQRGKFWAAFLIAGSLKIVYDTLMLAMFLGYRT